MWSIGFNPLVPDGVFVGLGAATLLVAALAAYLRGVAVLLRAVALASLLLALSGPTLLREEREGVNDVVALVVDRSGSQRIADRASQTDRAAAEMKRRLDAVPGVETRVVEVPETDAGAEGTKLFGALQAGLSDVAPNRLAGVVMLTDGIVHDMPATQTLPFNAPLHALITGRPGERDRRIELVDAPRFGIVGRDQTIRVRVLDTGGNEPARLQVKRDGVPLTTLAAPVGQTVRVPIRVDHAGPNVVELEIAAQPGELTEANNRAVVTIEGVREKLRVLLVSGEPHAGERTWRNLLKSDANVDLVHFTILRPPEKQDGTPINELSLIAFPVRELFGEKIKEFDLIIFDRYANQSILPRLYFDNVVRYVREGGALMIAAGPEYAGIGSLSSTPLSQVLPTRPDGRVIEEPFRARISQLGRRHPVTRDLPGGGQEPPAWSEWLRLVSARATAGTTVMDGPAGRPLMVLNREEKGRVAVVLSDHAWLWARGYKEGGPHLEMLRRVSHWLMKEPQLEEEALRGTGRGRTLLIERQTMAERSGPVTVTLPSGAVRTVEVSEREPGRFTGSVDSDEIGLHRLNEGALIAFVGVGPDNPRELRDVVSDTERLRPLAEATGGSVRRIAAASGDALRLPGVIAMRSGTRFASGDSIGLRLNDQSITRGLSVWPVFLGLAGLLLLGSILIGTWLSEARRTPSRA